MPPLQSRHCEERSDAAIQSRMALCSGLRRYTRNDESVAVIPDLIGDPERLAMRLLDSRFRGNDGARTESREVEI